MSEYMVLKRYEPVDYGDTAHLLASQLDIFSKRMKNNNKTFGYNRGSWQYRMHRNVGGYDAVFNHKSDVMCRKASEPKMRKLVALCIQYKIKATSKVGGENKRVVVGAYTVNGCAYRKNSKIDTLDTVVLIRDIYDLVSSFNNIRRLYMDIITYGGREIKVRKYDADTCTPVVRALAYYSDGEVESYSGPDNNLLDDLGLYYDFGIKSYCVKGFKDEINAHW